MALTAGPILQSVIASSVMSRSTRKDTFEKEVLLLILTVLLLAYLFLISSTAAGSVTVFLGFGHRRHSPLSPIALLGHLAKGIHVGINIVIITLGKSGLHAISALKFQVMYYLFYHLAWWSFGAGLCIYSLSINSIRSMYA